MRREDIEALGAVAYASKMRPSQIQELGEHVQVWACHIAAQHARATHKYLTLEKAVFMRENETLTITPADLPEPTKYGLSVPEFMRVLWEKLPHKTKKTRVILAVFGTAENYGALNVHDLDERLTYHPAGQNAYSLKYVNGTDENVEFLDLSVWFPDQTPADVAAQLGLDAHTLDAEPCPAVRECKYTSAIYAALSVTLDREYGLDPAKYRTPAAAAAKIYTSGYLDAAPAGKGQAAVLKAVRLQAMQSYWGGRAEAFFRGKYNGPVSIYDAVSLYPSAAIALGVLPRAKDWFRLTEGTLPVAKGGILTVRFQFPEDELHPCLPVPRGTNTVYPLSGISHCTLHEVRYARELGARVSILSGYGYMTGDDSVSRYSADLLERKNAASDKGNTAQRTVYKLLLNSLYGKFGQHRVGFDLNVMRAVARKMNLPNLGALEKISNWRHIAGDLLAGGEGEALEPEIITGALWFPEWAALIQGYARMIESRAMRDYVALTGTTDSVVIMGSAGPEFDVLGVKFKLETEGDSAVIVRSRLYVISEGEKIKKAALHGAPNIAAMPQMLMAWRGEEVLEVQTVRVRKLREGLSKGGLVGKNQGVKVGVRMGWDNKRVLDGNYSNPLGD